MKPVWCMIESSVPARAISFVTKLLIGSEFNWDKSSPCNWRGLSLSFGCLLALAFGKIPYGTMRWLFARSM